MRFGGVGRLAAPLLYWQLPLRTGVAREDLRPVQAIRQVQVPVLVAGGTRDTQTPSEETRRLFEAAGGAKTLWLVEGAIHEDLYAFNPAEYRVRLLRFLDTLEAVAG